MKLQLQTYPGRWFGAMIVFAKPRPRELLLSGVLLLADGRVEA